MLVVMEGKSESLPASRKVFEAISVDETLVLSVWDDSQITGPAPEGVEILGLLTVYDAKSGSYYHRERVRISQSTRAGNEPSDAEKGEWLRAFSLFTND